VKAVTDLAFIVDSCALSGRGSSCSGDLRSRQSAGKDRARLLDAECGKLSDALAVLNSDYLRENDSSQHGIMGLAVFAIEG
jgi:hypothetical protein